MKRLGRLNHFLTDVSSDTTAAITGPNFPRQSRSGISKKKAVLIFFKHVHLMFMWVNTVLREILSKRNHGNEYFWHVFFYLCACILQGESVVLIMNIGHMSLQHRLHLCTQYTDFCITPPFCSPLNITHIET